MGKGCAAAASEGMESYASVFVEYMNYFNFEQVDMVNPEEKIDYTAYLVNLEKTLSNYLGSSIDVNGKGGSRNATKNLPRVAQNSARGGEAAQDKQYKKLRLTITSVNSQVLEMQQRILPPHLRRPEWNNS